MENFFSQAPTQAIMGGYNVMEGTKWLQDSPNFPSNVRITGSDPQLLTWNLQPGQQFMSESGTLLFKDAYVKHTTNMGALGDALMRACCAGEDICRLKFVNEAQKAGGVAVTPQYPAKVIPINLDDLGGEITIKKSVFMAATDTEIRFRLRFPSSIGTALVGGLGIILQSVKGNGWLFLNAAGTILTKNLQAGEECVCDGEALVAFSQSCEYTYRLAVKKECKDGCAACCFAGEGAFNAVIKGPGFIILQTCPFDKLAKQLAPKGDGGGGGGDGGGGGGG